MTRPTIDELEILTPDQLGKLLRSEVYRDYPDVQYIQDLLDVGAPIDYRADGGWTSLHSAARYGKIEVVSLLLSNGVDIHIKDYDGRTAWKLSLGKMRETFPELEPK